VSDIRLDLDHLTATRDALTEVAGRLDGIGDTYRHLPDAAGHIRLSLALGGFRDAWTVHREDLLEELRFLQEAAGAIADTFRELDGELAARARHVAEVAGQTPGGGS